jgi:peptidoglycan hydrolase-like protein with peptidoglycan-binding domain
MADADPPDRDPDDWWADIPDDESGGRGEPRSGQQAPYQTAPLGYRIKEQLPLTPRARLLGAVGVGILVLLLIGLAVGGVFSSSSKKPQPTTPPTTTTGTTTPTTTTTPKPTVTAPTVALKPGDTGAQVKNLQRSLASLGYPPGKIDGVYGPKTTDAVKSFQKAEGLVEDGVVGPKTLAALQAKVQ